MAKVYPPHPCGYCGKIITTRGKYCCKVCGSSDYYHKNKENMKVRVRKPDWTEPCPFCESGLVPKFRSYKTYREVFTCASLECKNKYRAQRVAEVRGSKSPQRRTDLSKEFRETYCNQRGACKNYGECSWLLEKPWPYERGKRCFVENPERGLVVARNSLALCVEHSRHSGVSGNSLEY